MSAIEIETSSEAERAVRAGFFGEHAPGTGQRRVTQLADVLQEGLSVLGERNRQQVCLLHPNHAELRINLRQEIGSQWTLRFWNKR
jgi:hypothetical protein